LGPPPTLVPEENLWEFVEQFLQAGSPSCYPIISVKAMEGKQNTNPPNQWPGLILFHPLPDSWQKGLCFLYASSPTPLPLFLK